MKLTVTYIALNEEKNIKRSIESIKHIADEIVVVDTGSTDNTRIEAAKLGAVVYDYTGEMVEIDGKKMIASFADARNFGLERCNGDWILALDADEWMEKPHADGILKLIEREDIDMWELNQYSKMGENYVNCPSIRLYKNLPDIRYKYRIHESVAYSKNGFKLGKSNIKFNHIGYDGDRQLRAKHNRGLVRMEDEHPLADYYRGLAYVQDNDIEKGEPYLKKIIKDKKYNPYIRAYIFNVLGEIAQKQGMLLRAVLLYKASIETEPQQNLAYQLLGNLYLSVGLYDTAYETFEKILERDGLIYMVNDFSIDKEQLKESLEIMKLYNQQEIEKIKTGDF